MPFNNAIDCGFICLEGAQHLLCIQCYWWYLLGLALGMMITMTMTGMMMMTEMLMIFNVTVLIVMTIDHDQHVRPWSIEHHWQEKPLHHNFFQQLFDNSFPSAQWSQSSASLSVGVITRWRRRSADPSSTAAQRDSRAAAAAAAAERSRQAGGDPQ